MTIAVGNLSRQDIEMLPRYRKRGPKEWSAACPFCDSDDDALRYWPERGNYWCRRCHAQGWVDSEQRLSADALRELQQQAEARAARERAEQKQRMIDMSADMDNIAATYHHQMTDRSYWYSQGLDDTAIDKYRLGWCPRCPTFRQSSSHTIPVSFAGGTLQIRHRLAKPPTPGDKYRPELPGMRVMMFNADLLNTDTPAVLVVEGEVKSMALTERGFPAVGIPGASSFKEKWGRVFARFAEVMVVFDPGAEEQAQRTASIIGDNARTVTLPVKPDDFFVVYGGTASLFSAFLGQGRA